MIDVLNTVCLTENQQIAIPDEKQYHLYYNPTDQPIFNPNNRVIICTKSDLNSHDKSIAILKKIGKYTLLDRVMMCSSTPQKTLQDYVFKKIIMRRQAYSTIAGTPSALKVLIDQSVIQMDPNDREKLMRWKVVSLINFFKPTAHVALYVMMSLAIKTFDFVIAGKIIDALPLRIANFTTKIFSSFNFSFDSRIHEFIMRQSIDLSLLKIVSFPREAQSELAKFVIGMTIINKIGVVALVFFYQTWIPSVIIGLLTSALLRPITSKLELNAAFAMHGSNYTTELEIIKKAWEESLVTAPIPLPNPPDHVIENQLLEVPLSLIDDPQE